MSVYTGPDTPGVEITATLIVAIPSGDGIAKSNLFDRCATGTARVQADAPSYLFAVTQVLPIFGNSVVSPQPTRPQIWLTYFPCTYDGHSLPWPRF